MWSNGRPNCGLSIITMLDCRLFTRCQYQLVGVVRLATCATCGWRLTWRADAGGGTDIITYRKWEFGGISPTRPINMLLGIYDPTIIHDLQNAATYWKKVISYQTLEFKYLKSCFSAHQYKETPNFYEARR